MPCLALAVLFPSLAAADKPTLTVSDMTVEATGPDGAKVTYTITVTDDNGPPIVVCVPPDGSVLKLGTTNVVCAATDPETKQVATANFKVRVQDTTPPVVTVPGPVTVEATGPNGAAATFAAATATDLVSGTVPTACNRASGTNFPIGTTTVTCSAKDDKDNTGTATFTVTVQDTTPPVVNVPDDITAEATGPSTKVTYSGATASDKVSGKLTPSCAPASGSGFKVGKTTVTCSATDDAGNTGRGTFTITVKDTKPPVVNVPKDMTVEATGRSGATVTFTATASDSIDTSVKPVCSPSSGSVFKLGSTTVKCTATDDSGNSASDTFKITVQDTKPPSISVPNPINVQASSASGTRVSFSVSASDAVDGSVTPSCDPSSGSLFPFGATTVKCKASDDSDNSATASFTVTVRDSDGPAFSNVPSVVTAEAVGPSGAPVGYSSPTAVDDIDGPEPTSCSPAPESTFALGTTSVSCSATDSRGNSNSVSFAVKVVDSTPPVLTVPAPLKVSSQGAGTLSARAAPIAAFLDGATASDIVDGAVKVTNDAPDTFGVGVTNVVFSASDKAGNRVSTRSTVTVVRAAVPPSKPLDRTPPDNVRRLSGKPGGGTVTLTWTKPLARDFDHVSITRSTRNLARQKVVYKGSGSSFVDRGLQNGVDYRYVVVSYDHAGNRAAGVAIVLVPKASVLVAPTDGARVSAAPMLRWLPVAEASYYNVQLYRVGRRSVKRIYAGDVKILSVWPSAPRLQLASSWVFEKRHYRLLPGLYRWFVWAGFGQRQANKYGPVLGVSTFTVVAKKR